MGASLLYRLLGFGAIPRKARPLLEAETIIIAEEGMRGWISARNVTAPGTRYRRRLEGFSGCLVIGRMRIVCYTYGKKQINIRLDDPKITELHVGSPRGDTLVISFDSSLFRQGCTGIIQFRFRTDKAQDFCDIMASLGARQGTCRPVN